jgi:predicted RNase H-like HicB family nuclease
MTFTIAVEQEIDGRWVAEVADLPDVLAYGSSAAEAKARVQVLALRVVADRLEHGEEDPNYLANLFRSSMSEWPSTRARRVLAALQRIGWQIKRQTG